VQLMMIDLISSTFCFGVIRFVVRFSNGIEVNVHHEMIWYFRIRIQCSFAHFIVITKVIFLVTHKSDSNSQCPDLFSDRGSNVKTPINDENGCRTFAAIV
jgi:hypothetical protein